MAKKHPCITDELRRFIAEQPMFFVASAAAGGRVNVSPKGLDCLRLLSENRLCYLDLTGSSNDTAAHLLADGRITLLFCGFGPKPLILKLYGTARAIHAGDAEWQALAAPFGAPAGVRQIVVADIDLVVTSCGFGVPEMALVRQRPDLPRWAKAKGEAGLRDYRRANNRVSIDGLPTGLPEEA